jgi:hypothetical protein
MMQNDMCGKNYQVWIDHEQLNSLTSLGSTWHIMVMC